MEYIASQKKLKSLLEKHGFHIKKSFGQNFLIDKNILKKIVTTAEITAEDIVLEIGPGVGSLTQFLSESAKKVSCFEIDYKLEALLAESLAEYTNVEVVFADFLKTDLKAWYIQFSGESIKVVANLPYYITTPILEKLISWYVHEKPNLVSATVMMQKEVAARLMAVPSTKEYGSLSIFTQLFTEVKLAFIVPKTVFIPAPNIDSAIVHLKFKENKVFSTFEEAEEFMEFVRLGFCMRRKTLVNNLKQIMTGEQSIAILQKLKIDERVRAEQLTVDDFKRIYDTFKK
ncbi:ribosomal RNA small subunit methyltransferase A [Erysipelotrichaceae bacterium]|nr:ribosomal RNA small subunit methyltransferase A [Erysipelotrichaceae bacterium]